MAENANSKKKWIIVGVAVVVIAIVLVVLFSRISGGSANNKIEVVSQPSMSRRVVDNRFSPTVQVTVRNKTNETIRVCMTCTVYASDGSVTTSLTSSTVTLVAGETVTLTAKTSYTYTVLSYDNVCASFGDVKYEFY